jgi:hypothetical protein
VQKSIFPGEQNFLSGEDDRTAFCGSSPGRRRFDLKPGGNHGANDNGEYFLKK